MNITEQKFELHKSCGHLSQLQPLYCKVPSGEPWRLMGFKALTMKCNILDLNLSLFQHQLPNKEKKKKRKNSFFVLLSLHWRRNETLSSKTQLANVLKRLQLD